MCGVPRPRRRSPAAPSTARGNHWLDRRHRLATRDRLKPAPLVVRAAVEEPEEKLLHARGQLAGFAGADRFAVDRADRRDLGGRAAHEELVAEVEIFARDVALDDFDAVF